MKKILYILFVFLGSLALHSQTEGLRYQTMIIDPGTIELPGANVTDFIYPNKPVQLRFSIFSASESLEYQEIQETTTDTYGFVDVIIGKGQTTSNTVFTEIVWDGNPKTLRVEVALENNFSSLGEHPLTFIPYAYHRDITATGDLSVFGNTIFNNNLKVDGITNLNNDFYVNMEGATRLTGALDVRGESSFYSDVFINSGKQLAVSGELSVGEQTWLKKILEVTGTTTLNDSLQVANNRKTTLTGNLEVGGVGNLNNNVAITNESALSISGGLNVEGLTLFNADLTVNGITQLNNSFRVYNNAPTQLSGELTVQGRTQLNSTFDVDGEGNFNNLFRVNNGARTTLTGAMTVDLATNLNNGLYVNGDTSNTYLSGPLIVNGEIDFGSQLTVGGITNLFGALTVHNNEPTQFSGSLGVNGTTTLLNDLSVLGETTLNNTLEVSNNAQTNLTGSLTVNGATVLNSSLRVENEPATTLSGTLVVDSPTTLYSDVEVANAATTQLSGLLNVTGITQFENELQVLNGSSTNLSGRFEVAQQSTLNALNVWNNSSTTLSGTLGVEGISDFLNTVQIAGNTQINNDLSVTGASNFASITSNSVAVTSDQASYIATFSNTNGGNGDGIVIKLGRTHGAWNGSSYNNIPNPIFTTISDPAIQTALTDALTVLRGRLDNPSPTPLTLTEVFQLSPSAMKVGALTNINNTVFNEINNQLGLPIAFPDLNMPGQLLQNEITFFGGMGRICSGQSCFSVCIPFAGCYTVCIPPVNVCVGPIPRIYFPGINVPTLPIPTPTIPNPSEYLPKLPVNIPVGGLPNVDLPNISLGAVDNSLNSENVFMEFQDKDGRTAGAIKGQSLTDFRDNTLLDNVYMMNLLSDFVGVDLVDGITAGAVGISNVIDEFNKIGVSYESGNGDYAEWLERLDPQEPISAGDIVAVIGGKITRNLSEAQQVMVVSHRPIIMGNVPDEKEFYLGNTIAFTGQVPVKILGPVQTGDYIVANPTVPGYGKAIAPSNIQTTEIPFIVGKAWESNLKPGPKTVLTVVGQEALNFSATLESLEDRQQNLDTQLMEWQQRLSKLQNTVQTIEAQDNEMATKQ